MRIRKGDLVVVTSGNEAGKKGKILRVLPREGRLVIEGVNLRWKNLRKSPKSPQGGRVHREMPVADSNVLPLCSKCDRGVRVRLAEREGKRARLCAKCGQPVGAA